MLPWVAQLPAPSFSLLQEAGPFHLIMFFHNHVFHNLVFQEKLERLGAIHVFSKCVDIALGNMADGSSVLGIHAVHDLGRDDPCA